MQTVLHLTFYLDPVLSSSCIDLLGPARVDRGQHSI